MTIAIPPQYVAAPDGVRLAVYECGNPAGLELLLIHGFAQSHLCFAPQLDSELARHFRIVAFDLRGHGASDKPADAAAYQGGSVWARDVAAVMAAKRLRRPVLAGWSMGGRIIRQYLMNFGDNGVAGLNFVGSLVVEDPRARGPAGGRPRPPASAPLGVQLEAAIAFLDGCYAIKPSEADFRVAVGYNMLVPFHVREAIGGWSTDPTETIAALAKVRVPTLITHGRQDAIVLPLAAEMAAQAIPGARVSWFDACGHAPFQEDAGRFNSELAAFVASAAG
ncbi:alpha/beta fold hydrolase [Acidisphaera sp. S103]|uniref:alpha/beta fold hydrolase n=1 Tax=Acidisphaera sp. S103 TaxID=1747223 RepID=UPI00131EB3A7|nr:alpha/beta hydrolase [Acidisphaera sp. S103]